MFGIDILNEEAGTKKDKLIETCWTINPDLWYGRRQNISLIIE